MKKRTLSEKEKKELFQELDSKKQSFTYENIVNSDSIKQILSEIEEKNKKGL